MAIIIATGLPLKLKADEKMVKFESAIRQQLNAKKIRLSEFTVDEQKETITLKVRDAKAAEIATSLLKRIQGVTCKVLDDAWAEMMEEFGTAQPEQQETVKVTA